MGAEDLFREAGLSSEIFVEVPSGRRPLVPHDSVTTWMRSDDAFPLRVSAAALAGTPVHFDVADSLAAINPQRPWFSTRRPPLAEAFLWAFVVCVFTSTVLMARRNLRAGEGDLDGAWKLGGFVAIAGVLSIWTRAHHVPEVLAELVLMLGVCASALLWGRFSWLAYVGSEPHVRRLWPGTLVSWTRMLAGRIRDPLVGRDVLVGVLAGVAVSAAAIIRIDLMGGHPRELLTGPALAALRSPPPSGRTDRLRSAGRHSVRRR